MTSTPHSEISFLELLAEVDSLLGELNAWADSAPAWPAAATSKAIVRRLAERIDSLRVRLEAPLVVATLGGTGTGKSSLVNALVGSEVARTGRQRPTTMRPALISRPDIQPAMLGISPESVEWIPLDTPALRDLVLLDCPDPDTTEGASDAGTNLARLRELLPHCDVLLVTTTQQKYRSSRVADELRSAAAGARLIFVETHADTDDDIREDWAKALSTEFSTGEMFFVDSVRALEDSQAGLQPRGEFARLVSMLTRELAGAAGQRIRRANFLDLVEETLAVCRSRIDAAMPAVDALDAAITDQRARLAAQLALQMRGELLASRRQWESRLLGEVASRWGLSPFSLLLRIYLGLGSLFSGAALLRARTPAQMALWGAVAGAQALKRRRENSLADSAGSRALAWSWDEGVLRTACIIIDGYAAEAGLARSQTQAEQISRHAAEMGAAFISTTAVELERVLANLAGRHTGWFVRWRYEIGLAALAAPLLYRAGRNFFYDSWIAPELGLEIQAAPMLGVEFFVQAGFWLIVWCALLLWLFTNRLRRGLQTEIDQLAQRWSAPSSAAGVFRGLEAQCRDIRRFRQSCERLSAEVAALRERLSQPAPRLGSRLEK